MQSQEILGAITLVLEIITQRHVIKKKTNMGEISGQLNFPVNCSINVCMCYIDWKQNTGHNKFVLQTEFLKLWTA